VNIKNKQVIGFSAWPPKEPHNLGFVIYYDGMEGGVARATDYMKDLIKSGYKITNKVIPNGKTTRRNSKRYKTGFRG